MAEMSFWLHAQAEPQRIAVVDAEGRKTTAGELLAGCNQIVHALRARGVKPGEAIAMMMTNERPLLEVYLAATQAGWYITPINSHLTAHEVAYILKDSDSKALFCSPRTTQVGKDAARMAELGAVFSTADGTFEALKSGQPTTNPEERAAGAPMTYTSGTTGKPKGVRRPLPPASADVVAEMNAMFLRLFGVTPKDDGVHLVVSPLYHTAVLNFATNHLHFGHTLVLMDKWTPEGTLDRIAEYKVTTSHMVPTQFNRLLALPEEVKKKADTRSLRHMIHSAAPCPVDVKRRMLEWWGDVIYEYYAASEGGGTTATPQDWRKKPGTVGKAWPISEIKIAKDDGSVAAPNEVGTVWIKMGNHKFEYHKDKAKTSSSWKDDFFTVGDAGYLDEDGFLFLCDRKSDMIISGGVNIYPAEIEAVLVTHPKVRDAAVFGIPHADWGEEVKAVLEVAEGTPQVAEEILAFCRERLATFKIPKSIDFTDALPRDPNGKLYKRKLRDPYWQGRDRQI